PQPVQKRGSRGGLYALLAILLLGVGGAAAYFTMQGKDETTLPEPVVSAGKETTEQETKPPVVEDPPVTSGGDDDTDVAVSRPETKKQTEEISKPIDTVASRIDWLQKYNGGSCFFASGQSVSETKVEIEGFSTSTRPFEKMLQAFRDAHGIEPDIGVRLIRQEQCAVPQFLQEIRPLGGKPLELVLSSDLIKSGEAIKGGMTGIKDRISGLLLVDSDGFVYNLDIAGITSKTDSLLTFAVETSLKTAVAVPQLVVGIASNVELESIKPIDPQAAEKIFPQILKEIREKGATVSASMKFFKIGGS
ncbi:MAG: hypothetical protein ACR2PF_00620, partial [Rhizobiaceae bacterium]